MVTAAGGTRPAVAAPTAAIALVAAAPQQPCAHRLFWSLGLTVEVL